MILIINAKQQLPHLAFSTLFCILFNVTTVATKLRGKISKTFLSNQHFFLWLSDQYGHPFSIAYGHLVTSIQKGRFHVTFSDCYNIVITQTIQLRVG